MTVRLYSITQSRSDALLPAGSGDDDGCIVMQKICFLYVIASLCMSSKRYLCTHLYLGSNDLACCPCSLQELLSSLTIRCQIVNAENPGSWFWGICWENCQFFGLPRVPSSVMELVDSPIHQKLLPCVMFVVIWSVTF